MKKIKFISIFFITLLLCGCSAEYNLTINEDSMSEVITFYLDKTSENQKRFDDISKRKEISNYGEKEILNYYNVNTKENDENYQIDYKYKYTAIKNENNMMENINDLTQYSYLSQCYSDSSITESNGIMSIKAEGNFGCLYEGIEDVTVKINTDLKILDNNADQVSGNTYIWNINKKNYMNKPINLEIERYSNSDFGAKLIFLGGILVIALLITIIILIVKARHNQVNKI